MKEIHEKVKELKKKALEIIESKLNGELTTADLQSLCRCLNEVDDDKNWLMEMTKNLGSGSFNGGFATPTPQIGNDNKVN